MRTKEIFATLAVTGAVATFALLNVNANPSAKTFLATPISDAEREFISFIAQYRRSYGTKEEYEYRLDLFSKAWNTVQWHNAQPGNTYTLGINHLADYSDYERNLITGYKPSLRRDAPLTSNEPVPEVSATEIDWVSKGGVTGVKDQGSCGSCWSFSATGSLESAYFNKYGKLESFSEQELVDCSVKYGNLACSGGLMDSAFKYVIDNGITTEDSYPYHSGTDKKKGTCESEKHDTAFQITSYTDVAVNDYKALLAAVEKQAVSIAIQANQLAFQLYTGGIFTGTCGANLDHGVLVVGYGLNTDGTVSYWKVKNSWGGSWGESGYIRLSGDETLNKGAGQCGLLSGPPSYANA